MIEEKEKYYEYSELIPVISNKKLGAIYWDYENISFSNNNLENFLDQMGILLEKIEKKENIEFSIRKCYAHWGNIDIEVQEKIDKEKFNLIQVPNVRKNASDNKIMVEALSDFFQRNYELFILISSDGDYFSLTNELIKNKVKTIFISREKMTSKDLASLEITQYFIDNDGTIQFPKKIDKTELINIINKGLKDSILAFKKIEEKMKSTTLDFQIFQFRDWFDEYSKINEYNIHPEILMEIITIWDLYIATIENLGYPHSKDYESFFPENSQDNIDFYELNILKNIPESQIFNKSFNLTSETNCNNEIFEIFLINSILDDKNLEKIFHLIELFKNKNPSYRKILFNNLYRVLVKKFPQMSSFWKDYLDVPKEFFEKISNFCSERGLIDKITENSLWFKNKQNISRIIKEPPENNLKINNDNNKKIIQGEKDNKDKHFNKEVFKKEFDRDLKDLLTKIKRDNLNNRYYISKISERLINKYNNRNFKMKPYKLAGYSSMSKAIKKISIENNLGITQIQNYIYWDPD